MIDFMDPVVLAAAIGGFLIALFALIMLFRFIGRVRVERHYASVRAEACRQIDLLAQAISYADLIVGHADCDRTNYRDEMKDVRNCFAKLVAHRDLYNNGDGTGARLEQWEDITVVASKRVEELRYIGDAAGNFLKRVDSARAAIGEAELKLVSYNAPDGLQVELDKAQEQLRRARGLFEQHSLEDCRKVCSSVEVVLQMCEECARLDVALAEVEPKCEEGTWLFGAVQEAKAAKERCLKFFHYQYAEKTRDFFKATRIKLLSAVDDPDGGSLLIDED